jgi:hypothetical protein
MAGTTDDKCEVSHEIAPERQDIDFISKEISSVFG